MKKIELDVRNIHTVKALHIYLQYQLNLPEYYGRNLDALHDVLGEIGETTEIVLIGPALAGSELWAYWPRLLEVMEESAQENERLTVHL